MTMQIADTVDLEGEAFRLVGYHHRDEDKDLFHPQSLGLLVQSYTSSCWRGFCCDYAVADGRLVLRRFRTGLHPEHAEVAELGMGLRRFGRRPERKPGACFWSWNGLAEPLDFTGKLVVGLEYPNEPDAVGGYLCWRDPVEAPALHELYFDRGELIARVDLGAAAAAIRTRLQQEEHQPGTDRWLDLHRMADELFDRRLRRSEWDYARPDEEPVHWDEQEAHTGGRDLG